MRRILLAGFCLATVLAAAPTTQAGGKGDAPAVVVRVESLNALLKNLNLVVKLVGQEEAALQIEGLVKSKIGKKGLEGVDPARPFGAYVRFGKAIDDVNGAVLVPIIDEKAFLTLLDNLGVQYAKDKKGIYTYRTNQNFDVYFRFANKYLYVTSVTAEGIQDKNLADPVKALAVAGKAAISIAARIDQIPEDAKAIALAKLDEALKDAQQKAPPGESKAQEAFRLALLRDLNKLGASLIREAGEIRFDLDINEKSKDLTVNFAVAGKKGSDFAKAIQAVGALQSPLTGMLKKDLAFQGAFHLTLPESLKSALADVIDEAAKKSLDGIQDQGKRKQAESLFNAIMPTAKAGEFQVVAAVLGPTQDRYTFVTAIKLKDGVKLGKTVRDLVQESLKDIPPNLRDNIKLDFDSAGPVKIHRFEIPKDGKTDALIEQIAGDKYLYVAFRADALLLAFGKDALATLKGALAKSGSAPSQPLVFDFDVARMAKLMAKTQEQKDLAAKLFPAGQTGRVRLSVTGGSALTARLQMQLNVLEFLVKLNPKEQ